MEKAYVEKEGIDGFVEAVLWREYDKGCVCRKRRNVGGQSLERLHHRIAHCSQQLSDCTDTTDDAMR
jgi:hypothetical protein